MTRHRDYVPKIGIKRRVEVEQAIARGRGLLRPSQVMARFGLTYGEYREIADAMLDGYDHARAELVAKRAEERATDRNRLLRDLDRERARLLRDLEKEARAVAKSCAAPRPVGRPEQGAA